MRFPVPVTARRLGLAFAVTLAVVGVVGGVVWVTRSPDAPSGGGPVASVAGAQLERGPSTRVVDELARPSVRRVESTSCGVTRQGTATAVEVDGEVRVLTNRHVVAGASGATVVAADGDRTDLTVESSVTRRDAALLGPVDGPALTVGPTPVPGSGVVVVGFPRGEYRAEAGRVVAIERRHGYGGETDMLIVDVDAQPGISGGVVVDGAGRAVGLVAARDPDTHDTVAYPIAELAAGTVTDPPTC